MIQFKKIREYVLIVLGAIFAAGMVWACVAMIIFLAEILNASLVFDQKNIRAGEFDTTGFEQLHLIQEQRGGNTPTRAVPLQKITPTTSSVTSTIPRGL